MIIAKQTDVTKEDGYRLERNRNREGRASTLGPGRSGMRPIRSSLRCDPVDTPGQAANTSSRGMPACACCAPQIRQLHRRMDIDFPVSALVAGLREAGEGLERVLRHEPLGSREVARAVLFRNVRVFDGKASKLSGPSSVLVRGNKIARISSSPIPVETGDDVTVINGDGRALIPGLIDAHCHLTFYNLPMMLMNTAEPAYLQIRSGVAARDILMAGFTSVRDVSGPTFGLKRAIDEGAVAGPRIWPSGPMIAQTSGHNDFRALADLPAVANPGANANAGVRYGYSCVADGVAAVHVAARENLMRGASQIKLALGGGVSSNYDPVDVTEYTPPEIEAAVADAENWGTYVCTHVYTPRGIRQALGAGVKSIEHGHLIDNPTMELLAERGAWLSLQPFLNDEDAIPTAPGSPNEAKYREVANGTESAYTLAKKHGVKVAFGTDIQFNPNGAARQSFYLPKLTRWYPAADTLKMATAVNAELLAMSGPRNPYPGKLGVVEEGALADLLLVDGDPVADMTLLQNPQKNFRVIMKDGKIYKDDRPG